MIADLGPVSFQDGRGSACARAGAATSTADRINAAQHPSTLRRRSRLLDIGPPLPARLISKVQEQPPLDAASAARSFLRILSQYGPCFAKPHAMSREPASRISTLQ